MKPLTSQVHDLLAAMPLQAETVIDATAGNGYDTLFLAQCTGPQGKVYAFDIQSDAINQTAKRLSEAGHDHGEFFNASHAQMLKLLPPELIGEIAAITFNLGYLPGGDKTITTNVDSTQQAIFAAVKLLKPGGILTILAYTGHPGGIEEANAVQHLTSQLPSNEYSINEQTSSFAKADSPRLFVIRKNSTDKPGT